MDLKLYKNQLEKILKDLDKEIDVQFGKADESKINTTNITAILGRIDNQIINRAQIAKGMYGDEDTRKGIKQMIDDMNKEVKARLDRFADSVSNDDKKDEIGALYNKNVKNNATNKTQKQLDELESGSKKYERKDVNERLTDAKKEFAEAKKIYEKSEKYEKLKTSSGKTDAELEAQFTEFQADAQTWKDMLQKLEEVKKYDYQKNLEELASLANSGITVEKELVDKYKDFQKHLHFLRDKTVATALDGQDPAKMDINDIRINLSTLQSFNIEELPDIKDNADCVEAVNEVFNKKINKLDILNLFPEDKKKIKESLNDDSKTLADKWKDIEKFVKENRNVIKDLSKTSKNDAKVNMDKVDNKIKRLEEEKDNEEKAKKKPVPTAIDSTRINLTEIGLDDDEIVEDENGNLYDFAKVKEEDFDVVVDNLYAQIYDDEEAYEITKEHVKNNLSDPSKIKKGWHWVDRIRNFFGIPSKEDRQMEVHIKSALKNQIKQAKKDITAKIALEEEEYDKEKTEFEKAVQLSAKDKEKFNQKAAEIIVNSKGGANAKDVMKEAEDKMYSDLDR